MTASDLRSDETPHVPVLLDGVLKALAPRDGGIYVDGTFGNGGYTRAILDAAATHVIAIDRDPSAIEAGMAGGGADGRLTLVLGQFGEMNALVPPLLADMDTSAPDGIALDLGVSSMQLDQADRGFSFRHDGPLDMRMDSGERGTPSAAGVVNTYDAYDLAQIFRVLGEEKHAKRVAKAIVSRRQETPFTRTGDLAEVVAGAVGGKPQRIHPATRVFQALRIYVNDEMGELARGLMAAETLLAEGGRLAVVSFHSLEDRMVKRFFASRAGAVSNPSRHVPLAPKRPEPSFRLLSRKAQEPTEDEISLNPRARSARLRAAERTSAAAHAADFSQAGLAALGLPAMALSAGTAGGAA